MANFLTSDTHYGHANIMIYTAETHSPAPRPFIRDGDLVEVDDRHGGKKLTWVDKATATARANEMDEMLIANHNSVVSPDDDVWHMGDMSFHHDVPVTAAILRRLNGRIHFINGNHDKPMDRLKAEIDKGNYSDLKDKIDFLGDYAKVKLSDSKGQKHTFVMFHYPILVWDQAHYGRLQVCGHSHGNCPESAPDSTELKRLDVGVDTHNLTPWHIDDVVRHLKNKDLPELDHHSTKKARFKKD